MITLPEVLIRLVLATVLSGLVGFERESHGRAAGLRTHILVGVGATLFMLVSLYLSQVYGQDGSADPGRIAAQVVTGIGFLGAGTILRFGASIRGLTTAASIWGVAALGLAVGCGFYSGALGTTVIFLIALYFLSKLGPVIPAQVYFKILRIRGLNIDQYLEGIRNVLNQRKIGIERLEWARDLLKKEAESIELFLKFPHRGLEEELIREIGKLEKVQQVVLE